LHKKIFKMNGLRVYIDSANQNPFGGDEIFYSRRAAGPYYFWRYEAGPGRWRGSRVSLSDLAVRALSKASWKAVPSALQAKLVEHYLE